MKNQFYNFLLIIAIFISGNIFAQPANDNCAGAIALTIGAVPPCGTGIQTSTTTTAAGNITTATPGNPYIYQTACTGPSATQAFPANDVWYSFVATGYQANITVTSTFANPNISVYAGSCAALGGGVGGCATGSGGSATLVVTQMVIGTTYFIQVSGGVGQTGTFNLSMNISKDCTDCLTGSTLSVNPLPVNGAYAPGTTVTFCYHINQYNHVNTNWLHGVQLTFGSGWNAASLSAAVPTSTSTGGSWAYYSTAVGTVNGVNWGPGWYWDTTDPGTSPTNNFGDPAINANAGMWNFCVSLTTPVACTPGANLSVTFNTSGDGESGSWTSAACSGDSPNNFNAIGACCPPTMSSLPLNCNGVPTGSATATPVGAQNPYTYNWSGPGAYSSSSSGVPGANTVTGLAAGTYTVQIIDKNLCAVTNTVLVTQPTALAATVTPVNASCAAPGSITTAPAGGTPAYTYTWTGPGAYSSNAQSPTGLATAGVYTLTMSDTKGCTLTKTVTITSTGTVTSTFTGAGTQCLNGNSFTFTNTGSSGAGIFHTYSFAPAAGAPASYPSNTVGNYGPVSFTAPGSYTVTHTVTSGVCVSTTTAVVTINPNPLATLTATNPTCGNTNGIVLINDASCCAQTISTFASSLGAIAGQTVTGLGAGTPVITLTNSFGCTFTVSTTLTMTPGPTSIVITPTNATCGNNNGSFSFGSPTGGIPTYSYAINGGAFSATSPTTALAPGTYSVTVKDANGCVLTLPTTIANIAGPTAIAGTPGHASCAGATGTYTVTGVTGGTGAYTYSVDGGAFSGATTYSGLTSGTHSITVKDLNGCTFSTTFNVGLTAGITSAIVNSSPASCGTANGTSTVSGVTGGVPTYSYSYDGGAFTTVANTGGLTAGNHTVVVKDVNTCTLSIPYTIASLGAPTTSITSFSNVTCFGLSNGSCTVAIPTGGAGAPFTYSLTTPLQTNGTGQFSGLPPGTYNISVKDVGGCIATTTVTITQPTQVTVTPSSLPVLCNGGATGTINVVGAGGTPTYSYNLNGNVTYQSSTVFANQSAGTYLMGIKDVNGCTATQTIAVTQPAALAISVSTQNANCTSANGVASSTVTGGTGTITYTWAPTGGAAATSNSIAAGNYTVTATDGNGCTISSPAVVGLTPGGTAAITASTNVSCNGLCDGSLTAGNVGGTGPFTYSWTPGGQTSAVATGLCPGTYSCTITDFFGCKSTAIGTITQPSVLTAIMNSNNVKCFGTATGTVSAAGSGGAGGYIYSWPTLASTLSTVPNVSVNNYSCTITDANGCSITASITVTEPSSITITSTVTSANCGQANGSATITASGGVGVFTYTWSTTGSNTIVQPNVVANTYTVLVKDANNCTQTLPVTIPNIAGPTISVTSQTNVTCFGLCNGVATTSVSGGVTPYIYSWSNGQVTSSGTNLCAGLYTVSATDAAGCVTSTNVIISQPTALTVTISPTDPKCFGASNGSAIAAGFGGTPTYTYSWSNGSMGPSVSGLNANSYGLSLTDGNGCVVTSSMVLNNPSAMAASITSTNVTCFNACNGMAVASSTNGIGVISYVWTGGSSPVSSQTLTGACPGTYTVIGTDQNLCTASAQVIITQPTQVTANITSTGSVTCFGGNNGFAVVTPSGGTGAFTYTWSPSGGNAATASTLTAGNYTATVGDANGCTATAVATIAQPPAFTTTLTTTNVKCNAACDGTGNVAFTGGVGVPTFSWMPGLQAGISVNNLCAGSQTVIITSNGSCVNTITFTLTEPAPLTAAVSSTNSNCGQANGDMICVVGGGTSPYNYLWCNGVTTLANNNVTAGACSFSVTDANGCVAISSGLVNDIAGPVVSITSQTNVVCFGGTNGAANVNVTGGVTPYSYLWSGTPTFTTQNVSTGFNVGIKNITVTDAAGCIGTASVQITEPTQLVSAIGSFTNVTCAGFTNGAATMLVNGGTTAYTYTWTPSAQTSSLMVGVGANTYTCNVTDGNGCTTSKQVVITEPQPLIIATSSFSNVSCFGGSNGQISTTVQGGTPIYSYTWNPVQSPSGPFLSGLTAGGYSLSVSDFNNCTTGATFNIIEPSALTSTYTSLPATCGLSNGSATVTVGGGTPLYNISWNTGPIQNGPIAINMQGGPSWIATITDSKGCTITQTVNVATPSLPSITGFSVNPPTCFGLPNGTVTVNYTSGTAPYTVAWSNPISQTVTTSALTQSVSGISAGLYSVTLTDNYGCSTSQPFSVTQPNMLILIPSPNVTICYGQSTQISASGTGGTPAYTYSWTPNTITGGGPTTVNPTTTTSYNVSVTDFNGCSTPPKVITVAVTPQLIITGFPVTKCEGDMVTLAPTITSPGNGGPYNFAWSNGVTTTSAPTTSISVPAVLPTPNQYTVTIDDGCTIPSASAVFTVNVNPVPQFTISANPRLGCSPLTVTLTGTSNGSNEQFNWVEFGLSGGPQQVVTLIDSGFYQLTLVVTNTVTGCSSQGIEKDYIYVYPAPIASFYADPFQTSILDPNINFINTSQGANTYYWDFGDPAAQNGSNNSSVVNPSHGYSFVGEYQVNLVAISIYGCKDTVAHLVEIKPDFALYVPNTFTPDDNGINDVFQPMGVGIDEENYRLDIYDRWGENIFTSNNFRKGWDGTVKGGSKSAPQGVYTYKMMVKDLQGNKHPKIGHVTVIRQNQ